MSDPNATDPAFRVGFAPGRCHASSVYRRVVRLPTGPSLAGVAVAICVWSVGAEAVRFSATDLRRWLPDLAVGLVWAACGLFVAAYTPAWRSGVLMAGVAVTWFLGNFAAVDVPVLAWVAVHGTYLHRAVLTHALLTFPTGRLSSRLTTVVVVAAYAVSLTPPLARSAAAACVISGVVVVAAGVRLKTSFGGARRPRITGLVASAVMFAAVCGSALVHVTRPELDEAALHVYELALTVIAGLLTSAAIRLRHDAVGVADVMVDLSERPPSEMSAALAQALGDPTARLGYWSPAQDFFIDADGRPFPTVPDSGRTLSVVRAPEGPLLAIDHDAGTSPLFDLTAPLEDAASLISANARLQADLRDRIRQVSAARRRLVQSEAHERRDLEQQLQDTAARRLTVLRSILERARAGATVDVARQLDDAVVQLEHASAELTRLSRGLYPSALGRAGLRAALDDLAQQLPIAVEVRADIGDGMPPDLEELVYFVCAEALANVVKHSSATAAVVVCTLDRGGLYITVSDDGVGGAAVSVGLGLTSMGDRVAAYGGSMAVDSPAGAGTRVAVEVPLERPARLAGQSRPAVS